MFLFRADSSAVPSCSRDPYFGTLLFILFSTSVIPVMTELKDAAYNHINTEEGTIWESCFKTSYEPTELRKFS